MAHNSSDENQMLKSQMLALEAELSALKKRVADRDSRFDYAMEATNDGLWDWDLRTNKIYFSRSFLRMLGYDYEQLPGDLRTFRRYFLHPQDLDQLEKQFVLAIESCQYSLVVQCRLLHKNGSTIWVQMKSKFFETDDTGRPWRCVGLNTDITDFIARRDELISAKAQAERANNIKSEFLARVGHEIRTPMNAIIGIGYLLEHTLLDEQQKSYLQSLNTAADSLLQIINQLLDFSKIESGIIQLESVHFDLVNLFEKTTRLFEVSALHRQVNIHFDIDPEVPHFLRGDASRVSQILNHFINNSFQHGKTDKVIVKVSQVFTKGNIIRLQFRVLDDGLGIAPETLHNIQQKLSVYRDADSKNQTSGIQICHHLIKLMQGQLSIDSTPGQGTQVVFTLNFEASHIGKKTLLEKPRDLRKLRVLIVDDNRIARTILCNTARSMNLDIQEADQAQLALEKIEEADRTGKPYHFLLCDYQMPKMHGLELAKLIKQSGSIAYKPVIFLISALHKDEIRHASDDTQYVDDFFTKPMSESRLFEAIANAVLHNTELDNLTQLVEPETETCGDLTGFNVLVAEDNLVNQQVLKGILRKKGVRHLIATNGREAVEMLNTSHEPFDAILMDLEMPEMDGIEATKTIRQGKKQSDIPIIAVTAQAMRGDREKCLAAGMDGYLSKPVNPELLYRTLYDIVSNKKNATENVKADQ
jgi:two-component system, sensor histidine kinase and response regulator